MSDVAQEIEYRALRHYSAAIGADPALVQGAGGNVSLKHAGVLWVKASGTWLAWADSRAIMVPVALPALLEAIAADDAAAMENASAFVRTDENPSGLRPSIETTLHALLPHRVVVHVHCVETIAWACRRDAETALAPLLAGLNWGFVPYVRPGAPLTRRIRATLRPGTDVLVLGNHGLVVGGATVADAARRVEDVSRRLRRPARPARALGTLPQREGYRPADDPLTHRIATDPRALAVARSGSLYPDHVIFLGPGITETPRPDAIMLVVPEQGVMLRADASAGAIALARCLADVTARLDQDEPLRVLSPAEEAELLGWDAEQYRRTIGTGTGR